MRMKYVFVLLQKQFFSSIIYEFIYKNKLLNFNELLMSTVEHVFILARVLDLYLYYSSLSKSMRL